MKCPACGQELKQSKKDPNYLLCFDCKKKYKAPAKKTTTQTKVVKEEVEVKEQEEEKKYSNIPAKKVREKRETEMRKAYDEMLSVEDDSKKKKKKKSTPKAEVVSDSYEDYELDHADEEDGAGSKLPIILLLIAIVIVIAVIAYMLFFR